jgi:VanZ family protein
VFVTVSIGVALAYGLLTEVLQAYVFTGRNGNAYDFFADGIGAFIGWLAFKIVYGKKIKTYSNKNQD